ncbi:Clavaminate synthase-like protein [Rhizopogon vinicolor AM-OR11-026]|uniref:Clavaminate synthase-like protein n=1 Tax=Rhizopogon vinicolor AM-OR11-026 TaxID=1314800 RepID=A0A1B7MK35_9AGAM|nr:Clavaminate synthase-like protein [Rhizopogon vinicolor AM-OR11-026]
MTSPTLPNVQHYEPAPPTKANLEYVDLAVIDFSKAATEEGRAELADKVKEGLHNHGFLYIVNHGYKQEETTRMFDIGDVPFSCVPDNEKPKYAAKMFEAGSEEGYKLRKYWVRDGIPDQLEQYCPNRHVNKLEHPEALLPLLPEIDKFCKFNHFHVLNNILRLIARSLELPEDTLVNKHNWDAPSETAVRFLKYFPSTEEGATDHLLQGHTDFGTVTVLWSQPVAGLQIQTREGEWRWICHMDNALVINVGDGIEFLTGGYYKATIHRVVQPVEDQRQYTRLGVIYFGRADDDVKLMPMAESPVLQREGIERRWDDNQAPTMERWGKERAIAYGKQGVNEVNINGVSVGYHD